MRKRILVVAAVLGGAILISRGPIPEPAAAEAVNDGASQPPENTATNSSGRTRAPAAGNTVAHVGTAMDPPAAPNNAVTAVTDDSTAVAPRISRESTHPAATEMAHPEIEGHATKDGVGGGTPQPAGPSGLAGAAPLVTPVPSTGASGFAGAAPLVTPVPSGGGGGVPASRS